MDKREKSFGHEVNSDMQVRELVAAGWVAKTPTLWQSPKGKLYLGPYGAWKVMRGLEYEDFASSAMQERRTINGDQERACKSLGVEFDTFGN